MSKHSSNRMIRLAQACGEYTTTSTWIFALGKCPALYRKYLNVAYAPHCSINTGCIVYGVRRCVATGNYILWRENGSWFVDRLRFGNRPEKEDVYLDVAGFARKFDLWLAKLPHNLKHPWAVCFATSSQG